MSKLAPTMKSAYRWLAPKDRLTITNGVLLYAPNVIRATAAIFCIVGVIFSIPYCLEYLNDARLVITRLVVVGLACLATSILFIYVDRFYKASVLACVFLGTTVTLATPTYMDGPNINPHAMLAVAFVLGAGFCLGRRGVVITLVWLIVNYLLIIATAGWEIWPHPTSISVADVQYENTSALFFLLLSFTPFVLGYLAIVERSTADLQKSHDDQAHLLQTLIVTRENERTQLSHALHEGPVQDLGALRLAVMNGTDPKYIIPLIDDVLKKLRTLSSELHPASLNVFGLSTALEQLAHQNVHEGTVDFEVSDSMPEHLDPQVGIVLFRIAQEALTNARKHSGAQHITMRLRQSKDIITLAIEDDGRGFNVEPVLRQAVQTDHLGLAMLHELAHSVDGDLHIRSRPQHGTTITVSVPYPGSQISPEQSAYQGEKRSLI